MFAASEASCEKLLNSTKARKGDALVTVAHGEKTFRFDDTFADGETSALWRIAGREACGGSESHMTRGRSLAYRDGHWLQHTEGGALTRGLTKRTDNWKCSGASNEGVSWLPSCGCGTKHGIVSRSGLRGHGCHTDTVNDEDQRMKKLLSDAQSDRNILVARSRDRRIQKVRSMAGQD